MYYSSLVQRKEFPKNSFSTWKEPMDFMKFELNFKETSIENES